MRIGDARARRRLIGLTLVVWVCIWLGFGGPTPFGHMFREAKSLSRADIAGLYAEGRIWCFRPDAEARCAWAETAADAADDAFEATVFYRTGTVMLGERPIMRIGSVRNRLEYRGNRLCEAGAPPIVRDSFGFYDDDRGEVRPRAHLWPASDEAYRALLANRGDVGDAEICFEYERAEPSPAGAAYIQHTLVDGVRQGDPDRFVIVERYYIAFLAEG